MKTRFFPIVSLLALTLLSACASAGPETSGVVTSTVPVTALHAAATPRGPKLEATDPATVSLASGQLQLVEFFRFT
jgi:hypothetical protein